MLPRKAIIAGACALGLASAAQAEEHYVVLTGFSYFPSIVYVSPGDTIQFVNESGDTQTVVGKDAGWTVGPLENDEQGALVVTEETELAFFAAFDKFTDENGDGIDDVTGDAGTYEDAAIRAEITFAPPPLN